MKQESSRNAAAKSLLWLGLCALSLLGAILWALGWASSVSGGGQSANGQALDFDAKTISLVAAYEPPQLDSTRTQDTASQFVLGHVMEGLLRFDQHNEIAPGVAESWEIRPDGATFKLRKNAFWSDGKPVTAHDFVFAWRLVVNPANASPYAFLVYPVKNAEEITNGKLPPESLGVVAVGDYELIVSFANPVPYFDKIAAYATLLPVREDYHERQSGRYAADADKLLFNGPFLLTRWVHGASYRLEKNPNYWDSGRIHLEAIDVPYLTTDSNATLNLYRDGRVAMIGQEAGLGSESLKQVVNAGWPVRQMRDGSVWYLELNHRRDRLTRNLNLRRALQLVIDKGELLYRVIKTPGYIPADSLFPVWLRGVNGLFRQEYPAPQTRVDVTEARRYLSLAKRELGVDALPPLVLLFDDTPSAAKQAEYFQRVFKEQLGIELRLDPQIFKQRLAKTQAGDFDLAMVGWAPDYADPLTFGELFASWNSNNKGHYDNPDLDRLVRIAQASVDARTRMDAFGEIQKILIDNVVVIPNYERGQSYVQNSRLRGVVRRSVGTDPDFTNAYVVED